MLKHIKALFKNKKGLTLVETLVAITILALVLFCLTPLFVNNLGTIKTSGDIAVSVYHNAGIMQKVLANYKTGDSTSNAGYSVDVAKSNITLTDGAADPTSYTVKAIGRLLSSNPSNMSQGFSTVRADAPDVAFQVFPKSLTDDFKEAYITVVAIGFTFDDALNSTAYELYCNKNGIKTKLKFGEDYTIQRPQDGDKGILHLVLYGGTDINFSNSPLTFEYGGYSKEIEIDAPAMIMVGEKSPERGYHYYVSRGELDENDNLIILERTMGDGVPLTSAMNDVAWVSAEDADQYAVGRDGETKYGYYVMCGDEGQIRRFWQNPTTGNYYWGGDYTYYTDIKFNRTDNNNYFNATKTLSTNVSYKFLTKRNLGNGFNLGNKNDKISLQNRNMWTVTAFGGNDTQIYTSDGRMFYYLMDEGVASKESNPNSKHLTPDQVGTYSNAINNILGTGSDGSRTYSGYKLRWVDNYSFFDNQSYTWLQGDADSYYDINGIAAGTVNTDSYPITLTSVGAVVLTRPSGSTDTTNYAYETNVTNGTYDLNVSGATYNVSYPTASYTLYCGYIPAAMDVWTTDITEDDRGSSISGGLVSGETAGSNGYRTITSKVKANGDTVARVYNTLQNSQTEKSMLWKGTFGITPYLTTGTQLNIDNDYQVAWAGYVEATEWFTKKKWYDYAMYWPYTNLGYAVTGKFYDSKTPAGTVGTYDNIELMESLTYSIRQADTWAKNATKQRNITNGKVVDITAGYFSHPLAIHIAANPLDGKCFPVQNTASDMDNITQVWNNRRENTTILRIASTRVPVPDTGNDAKDISVSLAVGYTTGGLVQYVNNKDAYVNTIMNNGIVYIRAGDAYIGTGDTSNSKTGEYYATDKNGFMLNKESNYFHQFYFIDSKVLQNYLEKSSYVENGGGAWAGGDQYQGVTTKHIGNMYGARYWQNNRHINYLSITGETPDYNDHNQNVSTNGNNLKGNGNVNYLRCHPLNNTKVTCVCWGTTWDNNPEAMWGTENGTVLGWWVDLNKAQQLTTESDYYAQNGRYSGDIGVGAGPGPNNAQKCANWNANSTAAEFQNYVWIDNCNDKAFAATGSATAETNNLEYIGSHWGSKNSWSTTQFSTTAIRESFKTFFDKSTQELNLWKNNYGFISTLATINDICYANDYWVAVGNYSGKNPAEYCGSGTLENQSNTSYGGSTVVRAYTGNDQDPSAGYGGSWVNVRYWYNRLPAGATQSESNATYLWKAVKISPNTHYNIVQINYLNGIWYATGYADWNGNGEWDAYEKAVVCWARDPLASCDSGAEGAWCEKTQFYVTSGKGQYTPIDAGQIGGINSVACRDDA